MSQVLQRFATALNKIRLMSKLTDKHGEEPPRAQIIVYDQNAATQVDSDPTARLVRAACHHSSYVAIRVRSKGIGWELLRYFGSGLTNLRIRARLGLYTTWCPDSGYA